MNGRNAMRSPSCQARHAANTPCAVLSAVCWPSFRRPARAAPYSLNFNVENLDMRKSLVAPLSSIHCATLNAFPAHFLAFSSFSCT